MGCGRSIEQVCGACQSSLVSAREMVRTNRNIGLYGYSPKAWIGCILASLPPPRGETPHAGDPAYTTAEEGSRSLVNEGFTTLP